MASRCECLSFRFFAPRCRVYHSVEGDMFQGTYLNSGLWMPPYNHSFFIGVRQPESPRKLYKDPCPESHLGDSEANSHKLLYPKE